MHSETLQRWQHPHDFFHDHQAGEKRTEMVFWLTVVMMVVEIIAGSVFNSVALLADGWHMGTHAAAFAIALFAYRYARQHAQSARFSFGTGKVGVLGGFASAVALAAVALMMAAEAVGRLFSPVDIHFNEAILVAAVGLAVNLVSAWLLGGEGHDHHHHHDHGHGHPHDHHDHDHDDDHGHPHDHNLRAAYLHVLADALTSVLAIVALLAGKYLGWNWLDPLMGLVGAVLISRWAYGLLLETSGILLDRSLDSGKLQAIRTTLEQDADNRVADLHAWKVGADDYALMVSLVTGNPRPAQHYRNLLAGFREVSHVTVEVILCEDAACGHAAAVR